MTVRYEHLLGKPFVHGSDDCYGLLREFFKDNFNIHLTDYARPDNWWDNGMNLYMENFYAEGFRVMDIPINQIQEADVLLCAVQSVVANHAGIYVGDGKILHHYVGRLSEVVPLKGIWRNTVCAHLRHKDVVISQSEETRPLTDFILPHKRKQIEDALKK